MDHDRRERRLGEVLEEPGEEEDRQQHRARGDDEQNRRLAARLLGRRGFRQAPGHRESLERTRADVRGAVADHLLARIDPVAALRRVCLRDRDGLREPDDHDRQGAGDELPDLIPADSRPRHEVEPGGNRPDDVDAVALEVECAHRDDRDAGDDERAGCLRHEAREAEQCPQREHSHEHGQPVPGADLTDRVDEDLHRIPGRLLDADELRELAHGNVEA